jgi:hypothetical protein
MVGGFMVFNATFNNISVISWWSVLLVEETGMGNDRDRLDRKLQAKFLAKELAEWYDSLINKDYVDS